MSTRPMSSIFAHEQARQAWETSLEVAERWKYISKQF